ncbi:MAG: PadR family transcriptional regulator [Ilumatobacter sp.]
MLLDEKPMHGYELISELSERSGGRWEPSPGTIYPALNRMEERGMVEAEEADGTRQYSLTDRGRARLAEVNNSRGERGAPWEEPGTGRRGDLRGKVAELVGQVRQIGRFGTPEQAEQAGKVLDDAKRQLYAILATEPEPDTAPNADDAPG